MFEDVLLESGGRMKTHRAATTFASLLLQSAFVGLLLLMPLIFVEALPPVKPIELPPAAPAPRAPERMMPLVNDGGGSNLDDTGRLVTPPSVPRTIELVADARPPGPGPAQESEAPDWGIVSGLGKDRNSVLRDLVSDAVRPVTTPSPPAPVARKSEAQQALLTHRVVPPYPELARKIRLEGPVVMRALISRDGSIEQLQVLSGHPFLRQAALDAVRQWRYRPYILNGQPVAVDTQITFNFVLSRD